MRTREDLRTEFKDGQRLATASETERHEYLGFLITKVYQGGELSFIERMTLGMLAKSLGFVILERDAG